MSKKTYKDLDEMLEQEKRLGPVSKRPLLFDPAGDNRELLDTLKARHELEGCEGTSSIVSLLDDEEIIAGRKRQTQAEKLLEIFDNSSLTWFQEYVEEVREKEKAFSEHQSRIARSREREIQFDKGCKGGLLRLAMLYELRGLRDPEHPKRGKATIIWEYLDGGDSRYLYLDFSDRRVTTREPRLYNFAFYRGTKTLRQKGRSRTIEAVVVIEDETGDEEAFGNSSFRHYFRRARELVRRAKDPQLSR